MKARTVLLIVTISLPTGSALSQVWEQVADSGFGNPDNKNPWTMVEFRGSLIVGTYNWQTGAEIWRSDDGLSWRPMISGGFGDPHNQGVASMAVFDDSLFAGTTNLEAGAEIWRSPDGKGWTQSAVGGFGDQGNTDVTSMAVFNGQLYAGTRSLAGAEIWRSSDGKSWNLVSSAGFGTIGNEQARSMAVHQSFLYVGTTNPTSGAEVWRTPDGVSWGRVILFPDPGNTAVTSMVTRDWDLMAATKNETSGGEIWMRSTDWSGDVFWWQMAQGGFGSQQNSQINALGLEAWRLYAGTRNHAFGAEVWREDLDWPTGEWEESAAGGFGTDTNLDVTSMANSGRYLYSGVFNWEEGSQIWRLPLQAPCPRLLSVLNSQTPVVEVAISGRLALLAAGSGGLRVADVGNRREPKEIGHLDTPGNALDVAVQGGYAFVADWTSVRVIDLRQPTRPKELDSLLLEDARAVSVSGLHAYVVGAAGLHVIDISDPEDISEIGFSPKPPTQYAWYGLDTSYSKDAIYVAARSELTVFDVSLPWSPRVAQTIPAVGDQQFVGVDVTPGTLYAGLAVGFHPSGSVFVYDLPTPLEPSFQYSLYPGGVTRGLRALEGALYVAFGGSWVVGSPGVSVIDIGNPSAARKQGEYRISDCRGVDQQSGIGYVACREGLAIFEHSHCWGWEVMSDGFESGDTSAWTGQQPLP